MTPPRYTLRQIGYFVAACEVGSVSDAALGAHVSQSTLSAGLAGLERALGVTLLIRRHARGVTPTPAGRRLLVEARALLRQAETLTRVAEGLDAEAAGVLELGCLVTLAPLVAPALCRAFAERFPAVSVELVEADQQELLERLRAGRLSLVLTYDLGLDDDVCFDVLADLAPQALLAADHPLAACDELELAVLAAEPLVLLDLPHSRDYFRSLFLAAGAEPRIGQRSTHPEVVRSLVANGFGYALVNAVPALGQAADGAAVVARRLAGAPRPMRLGLAALAGCSDTAAAAAFRAHCAATISAQHVPGLHLADR